MSTEIIVIIILMVMGGGIAYLGDWIGYTMGKRRLSVLGLRPRHTARVFTITSGAVIVVGTFLILLALNSSFRIAVRRGAQIVHRNHILTAENRGLQMQTTLAVEAEQQAQADKLAAIQARNAAAAQYEADGKKLAVDNNEIALANAQLLGVHKQLSGAQAQLADAKQKSANLTQQIATGESIVENQIEPGIKQMAYTAPIYVNGEEIDRRVIQSDQSVEEIKQQIRGFLLSLSVEAQSHGAARGANGRTVELATVKILTPGAAPAQANESDSVDAIADVIASYDKGSGSVVLIAQALGNAFPGKQAIITLKLHGNHLAITRGTLLGAVVIPVTDDDPDKILADLQQLLQRARQSASRAGVIPIKNPQTHESESGSVSVSDLVKAVEQVKAIRGPALVTASAAQDTYSADTLSLDFTVSAATTESSTTSGT